MFRDLLSAVRVFSFCLSIVPTVVMGQTTFSAGVIATGTMGPTNPPKPTLGTPINQNSMARLLSLNSVNDFCLFAPPTKQDIADSETIEVAWCTQPRNNARLIPDGTITGVSFIKTDFYVQLIGYGDLTKINIPAGDFGGELDPHGALGDGNPVGGNVTSNITGADENFAEWMVWFKAALGMINSASACAQTPIRHTVPPTCVGTNLTRWAARSSCLETDVQGKFKTCDADVAYPPGWYPTTTINGTPHFSTFAQRFTGTLPNGAVYTVGDLSTPAAPFSTPSSSNCVTTASISNGIDLAAVGTSIVPVTLTSGTITSTATAAGTLITPPPGASSGTTGSATTSAAQSTTTVKNSGALSLSTTNAQLYPAIALWTVLSSLGAIAVFN